MMQWFWGNDPIKCGEMIQWWGYGCVVILAGLEVKIIGYINAKKNAKKSHADL